MKLHLKVLITLSVTYLLNVSPSSAEVITNFSNFYTWNQSGSVTGTTDTVNLNLGNNKFNLDPAAVVGSNFSLTPATGQTHGFLIKQETNI